MDYENEETEEIIQIKDFNRKIKVNEHDLIPIDDIVEETYAITYKNLLEQIKKDTFYGGFEYFKKVIREIISKELIEYESYIEKMYLKIISKLIGLETEPNSIEFNDLLNKLKETLIENLKVSGNNVTSSKISTYNPNKREFELVEFQTLIDNLREIFTENTNLEKLKKHIRETFARIDDFQRVNNSISQLYVKKNNLYKELNIAAQLLGSSNYEDKELEFIAFSRSRGALKRLTTHHYLQGVPENFKYWGIPSKRDSFYSYSEFAEKSLYIDITGEKVELRFPRNLKNKSIYLNIILDIKSSTTTNDNMTKRINLKFSENNTSQSTTLYFYSGKQHNITQPLLTGWYKLEYALLDNDSNQDIPYLTKI
ncbi:hypothetical protein BOFE_09260 (plasmid) [Candidatus Borrelia fainii]|uniref:Uncharacterized protein n=1 Tax=Candidatus Borrelia fainii TaxID=2518322 RepID=A0ABM8DLJ1_9SPIR|nr:DUF685 domain-containing protein [Candidatus Borrelia fainii]BDU63386.1 hypothetical protein BOFE_09260 [Candidatus Borrelia fainii]